MDIKIQFAVKNDVEQLLPMDSWMKKESWEYKISGKQVILLIVDNQISGYLRYCAIWSTVPFLEVIYICPKHRKKGFSRKMLDFLIAHLKKEGYAALLSSSQTNEPEPQMWHIHMGFTSNGIIENIDDEGIGEVVFRQLLD